MCGIIPLKSKEESVIRKEMVSVKWRCYIQMVKKNLNIRMRIKSYYRDLRSRICGNKDSEYEHISRNTSERGEKRVERPNGGRS